MESKIDQPYVYRPYSVVYQSEAASFAKSLLASEHERFPVIDGDIENPVGVLSAKQLLNIKFTGVGDKEAIKAVTQPPVFVPDSWSGTRLL